VSTSTPLIWIVLPPVEISHSSGIANRSNCGGVNAAKTSRKAYWRAGVSSCMSPSSAMRCFSSAPVSDSGAAAGVDVGQDLLFGASAHAGEYRAVRLAAHAGTRTAISRR
jgi:hypothetical protein